MIVPQYWAEARAQHRERGRQVTLRRFGWSDTSLAEAQANADARAEEALRRSLSGERLRRREPKIAYNGAEGVPIREEIVSRHGETIITRNSYGARCLNTPNVFFADVDFHDEPPVHLTLAFLGLLLFGAAAAAWAANSRLLGVVLVGFGLSTAGLFAGALHRAIRRAKGGPEREALGRIVRFSERNPEWNLRVYRTPAGLRVLATHRTFSPGDPAVDECFHALGTDPLYAKMCLNQKCFRARVSPKPWRIGIGEHIRPTRGVWPVPPEHMAIRDAWIAKYEAAAESFAACTLVETIGSGITHPDARLVQELHDELCGASRRLPIA